MSDIVERLRSHTPPKIKDLDEAADEIERLRGALQDIAEMRVTVLPSLFMDESMAAYAKAALGTQADQPPAVVSTELAALRRFHDYFRDQCESLFADKGWPGVRLYNEAAAARRAADKPAEGAS